MATTVEANTILNTTTPPCTMLLRPRLMPQNEVRNIVAFIGLCPVLLTICLLGFFGNTLSFIVLFKEKQKNSSSFLMQALAIADNLVLFTFILYFVIPAVYDFTAKFEQGFDFFMLCRNFISFALWLSKTISIYIVVFMTAERCVAVCLPFKAVDWCTYKNSVKGLVGVILFSLAYNIPKLWYYTWPVYVYDECFKYKRPITRYLLQTNPLFNNIYTIGLYYVFIFIIPLSLLIGLNTKLIHSLHQAKAARGDMATTGNAKKSDKITERIVGVVTAFIILEFPALVVNAAVAIEMKATRTVTDAIFIASQLTYVLSATNSFINFYIYCLVGEKFRRQVLCVLGCAKPSASTFGSTASNVSSTVSQRNPKVENRNAIQNGGGQV